LLDFLLDDFFLPERLVLLLLGFFLDEVDFDADEAVTLLAEPSSRLTRKIKSIATATTITAPMPHIRAVLFAGVVSEVPPVTGWPVVSTVRLSASWFKASDDAADWKSSPSDAPGIVAGFCGLSVPGTSFVFTGFAVSINSFIYLCLKLYDTKL
jgi:hypothetical protein